MAPDSSRGASQARARGLLLSPPSRRSSRLPPPGFILERTCSSHQPIKRRLGERNRWRKLPSPRSDQGLKTSKIRGRLPTILQHRRIHHCPRSRNHPPQRKRQRLRLKYCPNPRPRPLSSRLRRLSARDKMRRRPAGADRNRQRPLRAVEQTLAFMKLCVPPHSMKNRPPWRESWQPSPGTLG